MSGPGPTKVVNSQTSWNILGYTWKMVRLLSLFDICLAFDVRLSKGKYFFMHECQCEIVAVIMLRQLIKTSLIHVKREQIC